MKIIVTCILGKHWDTVVTYAPIDQYTYIQSNKYVSPMAETPQHGDIVADTENVLQTVFVYIKCLKNCLQPLDIFPL